MATGGPASEFDALLRDHRLALRRPPAGLPLSVLRDAANAFMAKASGPDVAHVVDILVGQAPHHVAARLYRPVEGKDALPAVLYFHGGGFVMGNLDSHDAIFRMLAVESGCIVIALDYRLAPEARFPAPIEDGQTLLRWLLRTASEHGVDGTRLALAGDSAGGHIALALGLREAIAGRQTFRHIGLLYPMVDPGMASGSMESHATGYMLCRSFVEWAWESYRPAQGEEPGAGWQPLREDPQGLPPVTLIAAQWDPLRDEAAALARHLQSHGQALDYVEWPGMIHGFVGLPQLTDQAQAAMSHLGRNIAAALAREAPVTNALPDRRHAG